jgi:hypothetical protein
LDKLPLYKIKVNEDLASNEGIEFVSLVDYPAIEVNWVAFEKAAKFFFDGDKQMLYGPILIPNKPIYRNDPKMGEYNVTFPESEVIKLVRKLQAQKKTVNLNYQHQKDSQIKDAVIQEIWLTGKNDKSKDFGFDLPVNSAMVGVYISDKTFWNEEVKSGNVKGFSIEGWLDMELKSIKNMSTQKFMEATTPQGVLKTEGETFAVGGAATITGEDGKENPADGEYTLENGMVVKCVAGKITEVVEAVEQEKLDPETVEVIQKAIEPVIAKMQKDFEEKLAALKVELSNQPAGTQVKKQEAKPVEMSAIQKVKQLIKK